MLGTLQGERKSGNSGPLNTYEKFLVNFRVGHHFPGGAYQSKHLSSFLRALKTFASPNKLCLGPLQHCNELTKAQTERLHLYNTKQGIGTGKAEPRY